MNSILSFDSVGKRLGTRPVLRDVTLAVQPGEFVVLIGGSGSGKTTLLRIAAGLERADQGAVHLRGAAVDQPSFGRFVAPERRRIGMVFQDYALWPHYTCLENVEAAATGGKAERRAAAMELLDYMGMAHNAGARPHRLSGGEQQRVGVARALAAGSDLLLFDEALSAVDPDLRDRLRMDLGDLVRRRRAAALFVSHDPLDAWRLADRIAVLENGALTQVATPAELYARPATSRAARFTGAPGGFSADLAEREGAAGILLGDRFWPVTPVGVKAGERCRVHIRPEGVRRHEGGMAARPLRSVFESGRHRIEWALERCGLVLAGMESFPPAGDIGMIGIDSAHAFAYPLPVEGDSSGG